MTDPTKPHQCVCGHTHQVKISKHELHAGLVHALHVFWKKVQENQKAGNKWPNEIHLRRDLQLTFNQITNFSKTKFLGLTTQYLKSGKQRRGYWAITNQGVAFLEGRLRIQQGVRTIEEKVIDHFGPLVGIHDFVRKEPTWEIDAPVVEPAKERQQILT